MIVFLYKRAHHSRGGADDQVSFLLGWYIEMYLFCYSINLKKEKAINYAERANTGVTKHLKTKVLDSGITSQTI